MRTISFIITPILISIVAAYMLLLGHTYNNFYGTWTGNSSTLFFIMAYYPSMIVLPLTSFIVSFKGYRMQSTNKVLLAVNYGLAFLAMTLLVAMQRAGVVT